MSVALGHPLAVRPWLLLRFYLGLLQALGTLLRVAFLPRKRPVALAFFVNRVDAKGLARAVCPDAAFVRVNYPRSACGWDARALKWLVRRLTAAVGTRPVQAIVWGYRDRKNHGVDLDHYFGGCLRAERALVPPPRSLNTAFIVGTGPIYFDGRESTDLERRLNQLASQQLPRSDDGRRLLAHVLASRMTKYTYHGQPGEIPTASDLLIVGQCTGDQAITETRALALTNPGLIELVAKRVLPGHRFENIYFKPHPRSSTTASDLGYLLEQHPNIRIIDSKAQIIPILNARPTVATLTSGVGLEAALRGCVVHTFGVSFYSNWGFTVDHLPCPRRTNRLSAEDVFLCVAMEMTRYVSQNTGRRASAIEAFGLN